MKLTTSMIDKMEDSKENRKLLYDFYDKYMSGNRRLLTWVWNQLHLKFNEEEFNKDFLGGKKDKKDMNWFNYIDWNWLKETIKKGIEKSNLKSYAGDYNAEYQRRLEDEAAEAKKYELKKKINAKIDILDDDDIRSLLKKLEILD